MNLKKSVLALACCAALAAQAAHAISAPPGWPTSQIAMGTVVNGGQESAALSVRPVFGFFTYAGQDGAGDHDVVIRHDQKVDNIMNEVRTLSDRMQAPAMPTFVFYTVDGSSGDDSLKRDISNGTLTIHYQNLISLLQQLEGYRDTAHPVPATVLLNPDFLGELHKQCAQYYCPVPLNTPIDVKGELTKALQALNLDVAIPADLLGEHQSFPEYVQSINWLMHQFGPHITFGWQDNVWAGDPTGHGWVHQATSQPSIIAPHISGEVSFLQSMKLVTGNKDRDPQYIAFDKWERDVFDSEMAGLGVSNGYLYNARDMGVYMNYVSGVASGLGKLPVMLWQIPGGHLQTAGDVDQRYDHGSTEPDFILGNPQLAAGLSNVANYINDQAMPAGIYGSSATTVQAYLQADLANDPNSLSHDHLDLLRQANVFSVLWGGGNTTGVAGLKPSQDDNGWLFARIKAHGLNNGEGCQSGCDQPIVPTHGQDQNPGGNQGSGQSGDQGGTSAPVSPCGDVIGASGLPVWCAGQDHYNAGATVEYQNATWQAKWWANQGDQPGVADVWQRTGGQAPAGDSNWSADKTYDTAGTEVSYNGAIYQNQWWTKGDIPGQSAVWKQIGGQAPAADLSWSADKTYDTPGTEVSYNGASYQNQWWTKGDIPGQSAVWKRM
ncbi:hypothetical protein THUN1379_25140 [Paludibacterium sp. THUN1379]|uniref:carbohydrate-binding protein n=1 Tax=Paludibacterium sp. THUN1379 TaxID=3112107 RepID=UPI003091FD21|nr:hypothetical protein THUN1379_25140 [Paludibacterium sp. THUN1379]